MLSIKNLCAGYTKDNPILNGLNLTVEDGDVVGILGRNGSGKSTLAKAICGLIPFVSGGIWLNGEQILGKSTSEIAKKGVGFLQQGGRVFDNMTVLENINFVCYGLKKEEKRKRLLNIREWCNLLQKQDRQKMKASYLSGGEKHQLALAMVLLQNPTFLILDEPSAGLSFLNSKFLFQTIKKLKESNLRGILLIEQNLSIAENSSNKVLFMHESKFIQKNKVNIIS